MASMASTTPGSRQTNLSGSICFRWRDKGYCPFGDSCRFPHVGQGGAMGLDQRSASNLPRRAWKPRHQPDNSFSDASDDDASHKLLCFSWRDKGYCRFAESCKFAHTIVNTSPAVAPRTPEPGLQSGKTAPQTVSLPPPVATVAAGAPATPTKGSKPEDTPNGDLVVDVAATNQAPAYRYQFRMDPLAAAHVPSGSFYNDNATPMFSPSTRQSHYGGAAAPEDSSYGDKVRRKCFRFLNRGKCQYGDQCRFEHPTQSGQLSSPTDAVETKSLSDRELQLEAQARFPLVVIDGVDEAEYVLQELHQLRCVGFDAEGNDLGRYGELTVAVLIDASVGVKDRTAYVFDVLVINSLPGGRELLFGSHPLSLRSLLESIHVSKVTFDCRGDSDALYAQFGVVLRNVVDLQVYDQGVRRHEQTYKEEPGRVPYVTGMSAAAQRYLSHKDCVQLGIFNPTPHKMDPDVWGKRPLTENIWRYASGDAHTIALLFEAMRQRRIPAPMFQRVLKGSMRYTKVFRESPQAVQFPQDRDAILTDQPI